MEDMLAKEKPKIRLGISSCLLGMRVRYDSGHKEDRYLTETLGKYVEFVPVCPEVELGLGIPREPMHLTGDLDHPRLVTIHSQRDHTEAMTSWAKQRVKALEQEGLCGFIFKGGSPSSGMERVKVYMGKGAPVKKGTGLFAREFMNHFPWLPVEEEGRLYDPDLRENFIERIFVCRRWKGLLAQGIGRGGLVDFHTRHKLQIMAHSPNHYRWLGGLVGRGKELPTRELFSRYQAYLMDGLRLKATVAKNGNVLLHLLGYFKGRLSVDEKQEMLEIINHYRSGHYPLIVPVTLIAHYVRKYQQTYLKNQTYIHPHPIELRLRNHA